MRRRISKGMNILDKKIEYSKEEQKEIEELRNKELKLNYNPRAIKIIGVEDVPAEVKIVASLGSNFAYTATQDEERQESYISTLCEINKLANNTDIGVGDPIKRRKWRQNIELLMNEAETLKGSNKLSETETTQQQTFLLSMRDKTKSYLKDNKNTIITIADKGNITLITSRDIFNNLREEHLKDNIKNGNYEEVNKDMRATQQWIQAKYRQLITRIHGIKRENDMETRDQTLTKMGCAHNEADYVFTPGRLHGQIKVHKENPAYRPIIDTSTKIGKPLERWIFQRISKLYKKNKKYNIMETSEMIDIIERDYRNKTDNSNDRILSMDFSSMYTNIPVDKAMNIIKYLWDKNRELSMEMEGSIATSIVEFYTTINTIFVSEHRTFKQAKGLMMGAALSPVVAAITLDYTLQKITEEIRTSEKYVFMLYADDSLFIGNPTDLGKICQKLDEELPGMPYTIDNEDYNDEREDFNLDYLETSIRRKMTFDKEKGKMHNTITYAWKKKKCDSLRTLNFYSDHHETTKRNTVTYSLRKAVNITHKSHIQETITLWKNILQLNNYPEEYIMKVALEMTKRMITKYKEEENGFKKKDMAEKWHKARHILKIMMGKEGTLIYEGAYNDDMDYQWDMENHEGQDLEMQNDKREMDEDRGENGLNYAILPITPRLHNMKKIIKQMNPGIKISMRPLNKNKKHIFTVIKDKLDGAHQTNKIIKWRCEKCNVQFVARIWKKMVDTMLDKIVEYKSNYIWRHYKDEHDMDPVKPTKWVTISALGDNTEEKLDNRMAMELFHDKDLRVATKYTDNTIHGVILKRL